jgi:uncharacterized protein YndB with AHSA1/START domain
MTQDMIEREIVIDAAPEDVWAVLTEPEQIPLWFADEADLEARPGATGTLTFTAAGHVARLRVEAADRPHRFAYRWEYPEGEEPVEGNSTLVEFILVPEGSGTRLRLVESGMDSLRRTEEERAHYVEDHQNGWSAILPRLRDHFAARVGPRG